MNTANTQPDLRHLILLGGGHAQVSVLKNLAMNPMPGLRITLISRDVLTPYSGMLPGYIEGYYKAAEITIDLSHLARLAGARFIHAEVTSINPDDHTITITGRPALHYDLLSIDIGSSPDITSIPGATEFATPVKPISTLLDRFDDIMDRTEGRKIAIIGGGAAGVEMALSLQSRLQNQTNTAITLIHRGNRLVPEYPASAARHLAQICSDRGITVKCQTAVTAIGQDHINLSDGIDMPIDHTLLVTAGAAPDWLQKTGIALNDQGFIAVNHHLQSISHPAIFASGDIAGLDFDPRPKAGVFAVRAGKPLTENIRRFLLGKPLIAWRPQKRYLALIGTGGGMALPSRGGIALPPSRLAWRLKEYIDRAFITKFSAFPPMPKAPSAELAHDLTEEDPALADMRCLGCGAKTGHGTLEDALKQAAEITQRTYPDSTPFDDIASDSNIISDGKTSIVQSVDVISDLVTDPFLLGKIAARHAMSDLFASNVTPHSALAIITLPEARQQMQQDDIAQLMAGGMLALHEDGATLGGGHTSQGKTLQIGFSVTGFDQGKPAPEPQPGDVLILTKPLGIGVIMAGHASGHPAADGQLRETAIATMLESNGRAARILNAFGPVAMTDVTGFGLARHTLSLLSRGGKALSATIYDSKLPVIGGVDPLIAGGMHSSLYPLNKAAATVIMETATSDVIYHDPQTGGGLLIAMPEAKAEAALTRLVDGGIAASKIGVVTADGAPQIRVVS